ncbi:MAG: V-type ATP synthase subunit E family protein [Actinomycetota bacterium]
MTALETRTADPLAPVRAALVDRAREDAANEVERARQEAREILARARREADAIRAEARAQGEVDAEALLVAARLRARRHARAVVLRARRDVYDEARRQVRQRVSELRDQPAYRLLLDSLEARAREVLGADALVTEPPEGGVVAESHGRRFVCTLTELADRALARTADMEGLWSA